MNFIIAGWLWFKYNITMVMMDFHKFVVLPRGANVAFVTLISSLRLPNMEQGDFRLISHIGYLYNIIAKEISHSW